MEKLNMFDFTPINWHELSQFFDSHIQLANLRDCRILKKRTMWFLDLITIQVLDSHNLHDDQTLVKRASSYSTIILQKIIHGL